MFVQKAYSLEDLLGWDYIQSVVRTAAEVLGMPLQQAEALAREKVPFWPALHKEKLEWLSQRVGQRVTEPFADKNPGAPTDAFREAANLAAAPMGGAGSYRIGQDGRVYMAAKSEHYHIPLGHNFPGYRLITRARQLGILNATHNNTRGYITRLAERRLVAAANGVAPESAELEALLSSQAPDILNRVTNLETGSLAVEAGIKMMLARFYRQDKTYSAPKYVGKTPVFLVMQDYTGGKEANYHGTTAIAQTFRGMWPDMYERLEAAGVYKVVPVAVNDLGDFEAKLRQYNQGLYKTAGFLHEIILMNYGGLRLSEAFLQQAYRLCHETDTPCLADEIQSCMWYPGMFLFRQYSLQPDIVIIGKGFPGGEYPASKVLATGAMDGLCQFGALVTNGQEELASLAYLITMQFASDNAGQIGHLGKFLEEELRKVQREFPDLVLRIEGEAHLSTLLFHDVERAAAFTKALNTAGIDISAQLYKADCPPAALLKVPVVAGEKELLRLTQHIRRVLSAMDGKEME
ncbi:MAG: aminotransferase class III-fold pyridoxal phosphate-dependent enzyme [Oscillospiraceae bacterium]|nr:aminotransferase class III-fold pyridoxal phosphate-dependent enzyme [Oscillospiraceae bacterium]